MIAIVSWLRLQVRLIQRDDRLEVDVKLELEILGERSLWLLSLLICQIANFKSYEI